MEILQNFVAFSEYMNFNQGQVLALTNVTYDSDVPAQAEAGRESLRSFVTPCVWWHCLAKKGHLLHANFQRKFSLPFGFRLGAVHKRRRIFLAIFDIPLPHVKLLTLIGLHFEIAPSSRYSRSLLSICFIA